MKCLQQLSLRVVHQTYGRKDEERETGCRKFTRKTANNEYECVNPTDETITTH